MKEHDADIVSRYKAGESAVSIAESLGVVKRTVYNALERAGVKRTRVLISLTKEQETLVIQRYRDGESVFAMSKDFPVHLQTLHNVLKRNGVPVNPALARKDLDDEQRKTVIRMCLEGRTVGSIAKEFGVGQTQISHILRDYRANGGTLEMPQGRPPCKTLDHTAFDSITPESAYWMGFLFADGCISYDDFGAPSIVVGLAEKDRAHVEKFRAFVKSDHALYRDPLPTGYNGGPCIYFRFRSTRIADALVARGMVVKKAERAPVDELQNSRDFWRGMVDGDGSVYDYLYRVMLCGQRLIIDRFNDFLQAQLGFQLRVDKTDSGIFQVNATDKKRVKQILNLLYRDASTFLDRKYAGAKSNW